MGRRARDMPTPEQQYAAQQASSLRHQADRHDRQATSAYKEVARTAWDKSISDAELAAPRRDRATARQLREQADAAEAEAQPKKRGWFR